MMFEKISDSQLIAEIRDLVVMERRTTIQLLNHIAEMERRRCYSSLGFSSAFEFLTRDLGFSESAAWRRIQAARLLRSVPEASAKIELGEVNLTTLAQTQTAIRAEEKRTGERLSNDRKAQVVSQVESCSSREVERNLIAIFPEIEGRSDARDVVRNVDENSVRAHVTLTREQMEKLERLKEILSHRNFGGSLADVIEAAADELLERKDPLRRLVKPRAANNSTPNGEKKIAQSDTGAGGAMQKSVKPSTRNFVYRRDGGMCQFVGDTGRRCGNRSQIEIDHIIPRASGGGNGRENLRLLCRTHNLHAAEVTLGKQLMERYRKR